MSREELFSELMASNLDGEMVYIERRGEEYAWRRAAVADESLPFSPSSTDSMPEAWLFFSGNFPAPNAGVAAWRAFYDDLLAEMESMSGGVDRCRWPLDAPWPQRGH
ncbi:MAG: hypothetical protein ACT4NX_04320 [Deltaproteobacteria bacterium]